MKLVNEFKEFAVKGNPFQMAFAIMVGTSFGLIVNSITKDICMPLIGYATSGIDLKDLKYVLQEAYVNEAGKEMAEISVLYGKTIQFSITFAIIAISTFLTIRTFNAIKRAGDDPEDETISTPENIKLMKRQVQLLEKIDKKMNRDEPS